MSGSAAALTPFREEEPLNPSTQTWLAERGPAVASMVHQQSDTICERVSQRLTSSFPNLCYDPVRFDATTFQRQAHRETPRRLHRLMQVVMLCNSTDVVEREYRWGWRLLPRYRVERRHILAHIRWYFEEVFGSVPLSSEDKLGLLGLRDLVIQQVDHITTVDPQIPDHLQRRSRNNGSKNGHRLH